LDGVDVAGVGDDDGHAFELFEKGLCHGPSLAPARAGRKRRAHVTLMPRVATLRIVSYNVRYFGHALRGLASTRRCKQRIADALAGVDPLRDIVCLQEVERISVRSRIAFRRDHKEETQLESFMQAVDAALAGAGKHSPYEAFYFPAHAYGPSRWPIYTTGL